MILSKPNHIKIYGHRGARGDLPENTLESFKYLFENNINAYETDILISKDLIPVITHDFRLEPSFTKDSDRAVLYPTKTNFRFAEIIKNTKKYNKYFLILKPF